MSGHIPSIEGLTVLPEIPSGYISGPDFCERAGCTKPVLTKLRKLGRLDDTGIVWVKKGKARPKLFYSEAKVVVPYCDTRKYSPKVAAHKQKVKVSKASGRKLPPPPPPDMYTPPPVDIKPTDSLVEQANKMKLKREMVDLETKEINLRRMKNEDIPHEEVMELMKTVAIEISQSLKAVVPRVGAVFAAEEDPTKIMKILEKEHETALQGMGKTFEKYAKKRKTLSDKKNKKASK